MTRQKKEILRKIHEIQEFIEVDEYLGCGFAPPSFYDPLYDQINELEEELAHLSGFATAAEHWEYETEHYIDAYMARYNESPFNDLPFT